MIRTFIQEWKEHGLATILCWKVCPSKVNEQTAGSIVIQNLRRIPEGYAGS